MEEGPWRMTLTAIMCSSRLFYLQALLLELAKQVYLLDLAYPDKLIISFIHLSARMNNWYAGPLTNLLQPN